MVEDDRVESSKLHALLRLLDDILPRGHRVLIFSQSVIAEGSGAPLDLATMESLLAG